MRIGCAYVFARIIIKTNTTVSYKKIYIYIYNRVSWALVFILKTKDNMLKRQYYNIRFLKKKMKTIFYPPQPRLCHHRHCVVYIIIEPQSSSSVSRSFIRVTDIYCSCLELRNTRTRVETRIEVLVIHITISVDTFLCRHVRYRIVISRWRRYRYSYNTRTTTTVGDNSFTAQAVAFISVV